MQLLCCLAHDGQADAGTFKFAPRMQALKDAENLLEKTCFDADPVIAHGDRNAGVGCFLPVNLDRFLRRAVELQPVADQVAENLREQGAFNQDGRPVGRQAYIGRRVAPYPRSVR